MLDNSSSDDAAAILAALETIKTTGGTLYLLPGIYNMTSRLNLEDYHGVHIVGVSRDKTILKRGYFANENAVIRFAGGEHNSVENLTIDCDGWQGRGVTLSDHWSKADGVRVLNCPGFAFYLLGGGLTIGHPDATYYGVALDGTSATATVTNITQANPGAATTSVAHSFVTGDKVYLDTVSSGMTQVSQPQFTITMTGDTTFTLGVDTSGYGAWTGTVTATETNFEPICCKVINSRVEYNGRTAIETIAMRYAVEDNNYIYWTGSEALTAAGRTDYAIISNNTVLHSNRTDMIHEIDVDNGGSGYTSAPTVTFTGGPARAASG